MIVFKQLYQLRNLCGGERRESDIYGVFPHRLLNNVEEFFRIKIKKNGGLPFMSPYERVESSNISINPNERDGYSFGQF